MKEIREWWKGAWWVWTISNGKPIAFIRLAQQPDPPKLPC